MTDSLLRRRLYRREELPTILDLPSEQVSQLERTGQLTAIRICGEERFSAREIEALIETYLQIAQRRKTTNAN
jgi:hypothetical protein